MPAINLSVWEETGVLDHPNANCQKLDFILRNKVVYISKITKNATNKKRDSKSIFFNEKELKKMIWIILVKGNWLWNWGFCNLWQLLLNWLKDLQTF